MADSNPRISLVVSTVGRTWELSRLLDSLLAQEFKDFDIVVVDQNLDDRIAPILEQYCPKLIISRIQTPKRRGISSGRNDGWRQACGEFIVFPDDDCWYPPWFLAKGIRLLDSTKAELVSGRFADETGRSINGRFASRAHFITRRSVWTAQSESATFYRRKLLENQGGFDEELGIGGPLPWQAAEGPDFVLRALEHSAVCYYEPSLYGFHFEYDLDDPTGKMRKKGRMYGRGMGYVLRRHHYGFFSLLHWALRPLVTAFISGIRGRIHRVAYSLSVSIGRTEGWFGRLWDVGMGQGNDTVNSTAIMSQSNGSNTRFGKRRREMTGSYRARNPMLIGALIAADGIAKLLAKREKEEFGNRPLRILIANWGHLGDVVAILPLLKFLETHPRVQELGVLVGSWSRQVLESSDIAARIHVADHWALDRSNKSAFHKFKNYVARYPSLVNELSQCHYDMSIDTFSSFPSTHGITWSASIPRRVGFQSGGLGPCLTDPFEWIPDDRSMLSHQLELLEPLLGESHPKSLPASYPGFWSKARKHMSDVGTKPYIVIHMGPQDTRGWVPERWLSIAAALKDQGYDIVATGGPGKESEVARALRDKISFRDLTGRLSWGQFVATLANATAIVSVDSVTGHVAACFGVPTVILAAGRQRINLWRPNNSDAVMLTHPVACAPCHRTNGCAAMACVRRIESSDVLSSLQRIINRGRLRGQSIDA